MNSKMVVIIDIVAVLAIVALGLVAQSFLRQPEAATGAIEAIPFATTAEQMVVTD